MSYERQKLTPEAVSTLVKKIHADKNLKAKVIEAINTKGFAGAVEEFLEPSDRQKLRLDTYRNAPEGAQKLLNNALVLALETNGTVHLIHGTVERTSVDFSGSAGPGGVEVGVSVECLAQ